MDQIINWIVELFNRFFTKTPAFFRVLGALGAIAAFVTGLPALFDTFGINIPWWESVENKVIAVAGIVILIVSKLSVQKPIVSIQGDVVTKQTNSEKLPFTAEAEQKQAVEEGK